MVALTVMTDFLERASPREGRVVDVGNVEAANCGDGLRIFDDSTMTHVPVLGRSAVSAACAGCCRGRACAATARALTRGRPPAAL